MLKYSHPAQILLLLRDRGAINFMDVCHEFGVKFNYRQGVRSHFELELADTIVSLVAAGLVETERPFTSAEKPPKCQLRLSDNCLAVQKILGFSLKDMAKYKHGKTMQIAPIFGRPKQRSRDSEKHIFVLMPFHVNLDPVYSDHIKKVASKLGYTALRADDIFSNHPIIGDIWNSICSANMIVADCTGKNANVFYEVGLAHTLGKEVILIAQKIEDIPFDLQHLRCIVYGFTPRGMVEFEAALEKTIQYIEINAP